MHPHGSGQTSSGPWLRRHDLLKFIDTLYEGDLQGVLPGRARDPLRLFVALSLEGPRIHPTATVAPDAQIAPDAVIGPGPVIGPGVRVEAGAEIGKDACCLVSSAFCRARVGDGTGKLVPGQSTRTCSLTGSRGARICGMMRACTRWRFPVPSGWYAC